MYPDLALRCAGEQYLLFPPQDRPEPRADHRGGRHQARGGQGLGAAGEQDLQDRAGHGGRPQGQGGQGGGGIQEEEAVLLQERSRQDEDSQPRAVP